MNLCWFRNDLRVSDNPALFSALSEGAVCAVFILEETLTQRPHGGASKAWLHKSLEQLKFNLKKLGVPLILRRGDAKQIIPSLIEELDIQKVYWNRRYDPVDVEIDKSLKLSLHEAGVTVKSHKANLLFEPWEIVSAGSGQPYKVFSPFWKTALKHGLNTKQTQQPEMQDWPQNFMADITEPLESWNLIPETPDWSCEFWKHWQPGEVGARQKLDRFFEDGLSGYSSQRDIPSINGTSYLSPHLRFGEISPLQIWDSLNIFCGGDLTQDAHKFLAEIGWREFSHSILFHSEKLAERNWKPSFDNFPWQDNRSFLEAWQSGQTGYPLVDAGMRELWTTGYMHNRVRMVAASFLIKHLMQDWRHGERWFWDTLVDACPANNPASWQWVAGSGADAAPFFRIFNPIAQSEKFDPNGEYIRKWVPELSKLDNKSIHKPWEAPELVLKAADIHMGKTYPKPIVEHAGAREQALQAYKTLSE